MRTRNIAAAALLAAFAVPAAAAAATSTTTLEREVPRDRVTVAFPESAFLEEREISRVVQEVYGPGADVSSGAGASEVITRRARGRRSAARRRERPAGGAEARRPAAAGRDVDGRGRTPRGPRRDGHGHHVGR